MKTNKTIGLIGGMGPYASAHFYKLLLDKSGRDYSAKNNDDYPEILIDSVPVPYFISDTAKLPQAKKMLEERVRKMNDFGCSIMGMVCNTGHILHQELSEISQGEFVSMIDLVANKAASLHLRRVGVLSTQTTIKMGLYKEALEKLGIEAVNLTKICSLSTKQLFARWWQGKYRVRKWNYWKI